MVIAVTHADRKQVGLYRLGEGHRATALRVIQTPAWVSRVDGVQLDAREDPEVCLLLLGFEPDNRARRETWCYPPGGPTGHLLPLDGMSDQALSSDGSELVSYKLDEFGEEEPAALVFSQRSGTTFSPTYTVVLDPDQRPKECHVDGVVWAGGDNLVLGCLASGDDPSTYVVQSIAAIKSGATPGAGRTLRPTGPLAKGYDWFSRMTVLDDRTALATMKITYHCGEMEGTVCSPNLPPPKAVRLDLRTGEVLEVVAFAAKDRDLVDVSGGRHGLLYVTEGGSPLSKKVYARWPGEPKSQLVTGLLAQFEAIVVQH